MQCTSPLIRAETNETYRNQKGGISHKAVFIPRQEFDQMKENEKAMLKIRGLYRKIEPIGCGQCLACKLNYSRDRATLIMLEARNYPETSKWFVTVTYDDEHLPCHTYRDEMTGKKYTGFSLNIKDMQKFFKKIRKNNPEIKIKYVMAGEYGSKTMRPHYHIILLGMPLDISRLKLWNRNEWNQPIWKCSELEEYWNKGNIMVGALSWETAAYTCRYTLKKADNSRPKEWYYLQGLIPEFISWSNGFGDNYFLKNTREIIETDSVPIKNKKTGTMVKPPLKFYRTLGEYYPEVKELIKQKRIESGYAQNNSIKTDMDRESYRKTCAESLKANFKDIRRAI